jgi:hypothetical protein
MPLRTRDTEESKAVTVDDVKTKRPSRHTVSLSHTPRADLDVAVKRNVFLTCRAKNPALSLLLTYSEATNRYKQFKEEVTNILYCRMNKRSKLL